MKCPKCNTENRPGSTFCINCGARIDDVQDIPEVIVIEPEVVSSEETTNRNEENPEKVKRAGTAWQWIAFGTIILFFALTFSLFFFSWKIVSGSRKDFIDLVMSIIDSGNGLDMFLSIFNLIGAITAIGMTIWIFVRILISFSKKDYSIKLYLKLFTIYTPVLWGISALTELHGYSMQIPVIMSSCILIGLVIIDYAQSTIRKNSQFTLTIIMLAIALVIILGNPSVKGAIGNNEFWGLGFIRFIDILTNNAAALSLDSFLPAMAGISFGFSILATIGYVVFFIIFTRNPSLLSAKLLALGFTIVGCALLAMVFGAHFNLNNEQMVSGVSVYYNAPKIVFSSSSQPFVFLIIMILMTVNFAKDSNYLKK